jgi:integrase/recombinase XerD
VRVVKDRDGGIVRRVVLLDGAGVQVSPVTRFLAHLTDAGYSPNTVCAYGYDLRHLATFLDQHGLDWNEFRPSTVLEFLGYLRRLPSARPAQRLGLTVATEQGRLLSPATVQRILAATSSFLDWAIAAEQYTAGDNPMQRRVNHALGRVPERHQPFAGAASRQQPVRRTVRVRLPLRLPRPMSSEDIDALLVSLTTPRDLAIFLLMLDGGLRPGEVLCLQLDDISYGRRRVTIRKRDDHPRGARAKARHERVVDLHEPRTLDAVNLYVLHERPFEAESPFVFVVGGNGARRCDPLSYQAVACGFARRLDRLGIRSPDKTPHALRHTHATAMWEGGMRELALQKRLGHASPESIRIYTRVSDEQVLADLDRPQTVRHFRDALRRLVTWIAATHPEMTSLAELHREHAEEFLCWLGTQTSQHTGAPLSVSFRRSIVTLITRFVTETAAWDWDDVPARVLCETH